MSTRRFGYALKSIAEARLHVRRTLEGQPQDLIDVVELLTSELATNAVRHGGSGFELKIVVDSRVRVEVRDMGNGDPVVVDAGPQDASGRGLRLVATLSSAWGIIPASKGKTVWYELPVPREQGGAHQSGFAEDDTEGARSPRDRTSRGHGLAGGSRGNLLAAGCLEPRARGGHRVLGAWLALAA